MSSKILKTLHENEDLRGTFQKVLRYLLQVSVPPDKPEEALQGSRIRTTPYSSRELEEASLVFDQQLTALVNLTRAIEVDDDYTKIGHWCTRENESKVKGMDQWFVYWLDLRPSLEIFGQASDDIPVVEQVLVRLTLWAVGKDDNSVQKAIKIWAESHFPTWAVEKLQCVRR